jgi:Transposase DDE domain group 1
VKTNIARLRSERKRRDRKLKARRQRIRQRLDRANRDKYLRVARDAGPVFNESNVKYELADKARGIVYGGAGLMLKLAKQVGLVEAIDRRVQLLKVHCPYHESDHVLNLALNALCEGTCLQDIELRRNDAVFLDALGVAALPDPTTAGDFCRRFTESDVFELMDAINDARVNVWKRQSPDFFQEAVIDADGTLVVTTGECKGGMDISYKGTWGYHPLLISLANTQEPLFIVNRSGNRPSEEGAARWLDLAIKLCRSAGFCRVRLRGDTAFMQTPELDAWDAAGVLFQFGYDAMPNLKQLAEELPPGAWRKLKRTPGHVAVGKPRAKPPKVKRQVIRRREYLQLELKSEEVAEFDYQPTACSRKYRMVVVRKHISREKGEACLFEEIRYLFYITNDRDGSREEIVFGCNDRCDQENLISHLASGVRALKAPVDNLVSNWAYMVSTSLAWSLKAWSALLLPGASPPGTRVTDRHTWLRMEFKSWVNGVMKVPCQIVKQARRVIHRVLNGNECLSAFFQLCDLLENQVLLH